MVTKRMRALMLDGKRVWQIGFPIHWGYSGDAKHTGPLANLLTHSAIDPNTWTPEFKAFQVKLEKGGGADHGVPGLEIIQSSASLRGTGSGLRKVAQRRQAHRHLDLHRLQGVRGGLPGVERPPQRPDACRTAATRRCRRWTPTSGT